MNDRRGNSKSLDDVKEATFIKDRIDFEHNLYSKYVLKKI